MWKTIKYNLIILLVLLAIIEIVLQFFPVPDPYENAKRNMFFPVQNFSYIESQFDRNLKLQFATEEGLLGFENYKDTTNFTINNYGFRGKDLQMPKPNSEYRIFAIGGSTTENLYVDDADVWTALLEDKLIAGNYVSKDIKVYNAGKSGDNTVDHIAMLSHRIVHLQPDEVIIYCGINDLTRLLLDDNPLKFNTQKTKKDDVAFSAMFRMFLYEFQIPRRLYYVMHTEDDVLTTISLTSDYKKKVAKNQSRPILAQIPEIDVSNYAENLKTLIGICKLNNIKLTFATQVTSWNTNDDALQQWHWMTSRGGKRYNTQLLQQKMDALNEAMIIVSEQETVPVFRVDSIIPNTAKHLYDDCHFNPQGNVKMAETLAAFMMNNKTQE